MSAAPQEPRRWLDAGADAPAGVRALLLEAEPPGELSLPARARVRGRLQRALVRDGQGLLSWMPGGAFWAASLGVAMAAALLVSRPAAPHREHASLRSASAASHAATQAAAPTPTQRAARAAQASPQPARAAELDAPAATTPAAALAPKALGEGAALAQAMPAARPDGASEMLRERWRRQRWANQSRRSRERIAAIVDGILKPDVQLLERARGEVARDPARALALIEAFRKQHPIGDVPAPSVVVEVDALRRLGHFDEALQRARAFVDASDKDYYADEMRERFAFLEL